MIVYLFHSQFTLLEYHSETAEEVIKDLNRIAAFAY